MSIDNKVMFVIFFLECGYFFTKKFLEFTLSRSLVSKNKITHSIVQKNISQRPIESFTIYAIIFVYK